jgi:hypothetical protein
MPDQVRHDDSTTFYETVNFQSSIPACPNLGTKAGSDIFLRCTDGIDVEVFDQHILNIGRQKGRHRRTQPDAFEAQMEER